MHLLHGLVLIIKTQNDIIDLTFSPRCAKTRWPSRCDCLSYVCWYEACVTL